MATIKEIAALAGVSRGTVDRVLNNRGEVNADTKRKILEIANSLSYQPNKAGKALAAQKRKLKIGVLLFQKEDTPFDEILAGISEKLEELSVYGCTLLIKRTSFVLNEQLTVIDFFMVEKIHGLIISPFSHVEIQHRIDLLWEAGIPCITVNTDIPASNRIAYIGNDYYKCGQTAAGLLNMITTGPIKSGIIIGSSNSLCCKEQVQGFLDLLHTDYPQIEVIETIENMEDDFISYAAVTSLLHKHPDLSALYFTAAGAHGGCRAVVNTGLLKKISVISFGNTLAVKKLLESSVLSASISQQPKEMGRTSLTLLMEFLLTGQLPTKKHYLMKPIICIKENL